MAARFAPLTGRPNDAAIAEADNQPADPAQFLGESEAVFAHEIQNLGGGECSTPAAKSSARRLEPAAKVRRQFGGTALDGCLTITQGVRPPSDTMSVAAKPTFGNARHRS